MINKLLLYITGKELILYNPHRNSKPLVNEANRRRYIFFNPILIWKAAALFGKKSKLRHKIFYGALSLLDPKYIIDINWIDIRHTIYLVWCSNHNRSFIVIQHGGYDGGVLRFIPEKYVKCHIFLVWGEHFKKLAEGNNPGKNFECIVFGNTCYNNYERADFAYKKEVGNKILIAVSVIEGKRLKILNQLLEKLKDFGFEVKLKEHALQAKKAQPIEGIDKIEGNLYEILKSQEFDIVITDVSSAMIDIIFFKNRALYFSPAEAGSDLNDNVYSAYLENLANDIDEVKNRNRFLEFIDVEAQENLLNYLVKTENTSNDLSIVENQIKDMAEEMKQKPENKQSYTKTL